MSRLGLSIRKLWTVYFVHSAVALCKITSAWNIWKITGPRRVMLNKIVNINRITTKFGTVVLYTCMIMSTNCGKKCTIFAEVTLKHRRDPSSRARKRLTTVFYLRDLWYVRMYTCHAWMDVGYVYEASLGLQFKRRWWHDI